MCSPDGKQRADYGREMGDGARRKRGREVSEERERERGLTRERFGGGWGEAAR